MHTFWQDVRYGTRQLASQRTFTAVAVLTPTTEGSQVMPRGNNNMVGCNRSQPRAGVTLGR